jgi:hypothetical protein
VYFEKIGNALPIEKPLPERGFFVSRVAAETGFVANASKDSLLSGSMDLPEARQTYRPLTKDYEVQACAV